MKISTFINILESFFKMISFDKYVFTLFNGTVRRGVKIIEFLREKRIVFQRKRRKLNI